jgi:Galactose oxidase, central domain
MIIFGGRDDDNERMNDLWSFSFDTLTWTELKSKVGTPPVPRSGHSSSIYHCMLIIFGGILEVTHELNDMHAYDVTTGEWHLLYEEFGVGAAMSASPQRNGMTL